MQAASPARDCIVGNDGDSVVASCHQVSLWHSRLPSFLPSLDVRRPSVVSSFDYSECDGRIGVEGQGREFVGGVVSQSQHMWAEGGTEGEGRGRKRARGRREM